MALSRFPETNSSQRGGASLIMLVMMVSGVSLGMSYLGWQKNANEIKEVAKTSAVSNARMSNLSAISYLHSALDKGTDANALLRVEENKILGLGNNRLNIDSRGAVFTRPRISSAQVQDIGRLFSGEDVTSSRLNSESTRLEVIETTQLGHVATYTVRATTTAQNDRKTFGPITTLGRIKVDARTDAAGQEELTSCGGCLARAIALTAPLGYVASFKNSRNFEFYKVKASANLCDIHFLRNISDFIEDHDGTTSVLHDQVAVYCPCSCPYGQ